MVFPYTRDNKRYHTLSYYNSVRYGRRVEKASLDAGMGCPNRTGDGMGGCIFCDSGSRYFSGYGTITEQLQDEAARIYRKHPEAGLIAYFQAGTNTFAPVETLRRLWQEALGFPNVLGLSIATRADCLFPGVLALLGELSQRTDLTVELGLQTIHDHVAEKIGRGHSFVDFRAGYEALGALGIRTCVHLIDGLPGETGEMMLETARVVGELAPGGVKLHLLHVNRDTPLEELWRRGEYTPLEREEYIDIITEQLRYFPPETVIERLTGDGDRRRLLAPLWSQDKIAVLGGIDQAMSRKNIWQGELYHQK